MPHGGWADLAGAVADPDFECLFVDGSIVRVHQHGAGKKDRDLQAIGRSRGGLTTKIHAAVDALGNPVRLLLTAGQASEYGQANTLIDDYSANYIVADKGYVSNDFVDIIKAWLISKRQFRTLAGVDADTYRELVERLRPHDLEIRRRASPLAEASHVYADSGCQGLQKDHSAIDIPDKKTKATALTKDEYEYNHALIRFRVRVEHTPSAPSETTFQGAILVVSNIFVFCQKDTGIQKTVMPIKSAPWQVFSTSKLGLTARSRSGITPWSVRCYFCNRSNPEVSSER